MASAGIVCVGSTLRTAEGLVLSENRGIGAWLSACDAVVDGAEVTRTFAAPSLAGMGLAVVDASVLVAGELHVHEADGYGVLAATSRVELTAPTIERLRQAGAWADAEAELRVTDGTFVDNAGAAVAAVGARRLEVARTTVRGTRTAPLPTTGGGGVETFGDAVHVACAGDVPCALALSDLTMVANERVGLVIDGAGMPVDLRIERTRVETTGAQLGALAQDVAGLPAGWDAQVERIGSAVALDATAGPLAVSDGTSATGILMPPTISF